MKGKEKRLVIISHKKHVINHLDQLDVYVKGGFGAIKNEFSKHFKEIYLCVPVKIDTIKTNHKYNDNIKIIPLPSYESRKEFFRSLFSIIKILREQIQKSDIVYAMGPNDMGVLGMTIATLNRKPLFFSLDTDRAKVVLTREMNQVKKRIKHLLNEKVLYKYIQLIGKNKPAFITGNMFMGEYQNWHQWVKSTHLSYQLAPYIKPTKKDKNDIVNVTFAGRLSAEKNILTLIKAAERLVHKNYRIKLNIIGEGYMEDQLRSYCSDNELNFVEFLGFVPNSILRKNRFLDTDIFVLPSIEERQGKVLLEAMACSVPVIASNTGGIPTVVDHEINGLLFNPTSENDLSQKIERLINDYDILTELTCNGYKFAEQHSLDLEIEKIVKRVEKIYFNKGMK